MRINTTPMNTTILPYFAAVSIVAMLLGIIFNALPLALFAVAVSALILLIAATDYAPQPCHRPAMCLTSGRRETLPYAA